MKKLILVLILSITASKIFAGTCSSISRTNNTANTVLTSTKYNSDHNTAYNFINAYDGGCITDGTLEDGSLNTTDFDALLDGLTEGCKVTGSDSNTVSIDKCRASVNGKFVSTSSATTATWGCTGCASESASTDYYVYIKDGSDGSTLTPLILTTAPNADGYDGSNNKVIAKFTNDSSSDIEQNNIGQWIKNKVSGHNSIISVGTHGGFGSTNTKIPYFTTTITQQGLDITYQTSTANGDSYTVATRGMYFISFSYPGSATASCGVSLNSSQLTTNVQSITAADRLCLAQSGDTACHCSWAGILSANDVVRPHTQGNATGTAAVARFTIMKIGLEQ